MSVCMRALLTALASRVILLLQACCVRIPTTVRERARERGKERDRERRSVTDREWETHSGCRPTTAGALQMPS